MPPKTGQRYDSPFTPEQETWIILEFGALRNCLTVRRRFRLHYGLSPRKVPSIEAFKRLVKRFITTDGELRGKQIGGAPTIINEDLVNAVKDFVDSKVLMKQSVSVTGIGKALQISPSTAWRILRKRLGWYPYKPRTVVPLSNRHKEARVTFCNWLLEQSEDFEMKCIWSDEKWFQLKQGPNKQNERYWAPCDPEVEVECRVQGGQKVMCWAGVIEGQLIIHWFDNNVSVNGKHIWIY